MVAILNEISVVYENLLPLYAAGTVGSLTQSDDEELKKNLSQTTRVFNKLRAKTLFQETLEITKEIDEISLYISDSQSFFESLKGRLDEFERKYENFYQNRSQLNILKLINASEKLNLSLSAFSRFSSLVISSLEEPTNFLFTGNEKSLMILIDSDREISTFISKVNALKIIYDELCRVFEISTSEFPLKIIHLEFGSLWTKLFGESKVIALMTKFLEETAGYIYRNKTKEGKRKESSSKANELKQLLDLEHELKENGFDTTEMRESIQKASQMISQEYVNLLAGSNSVEVNGDKYSFSFDNPRNLFTTTKEPLQLEDGNQKDLN